MERIVEKVVEVPVERVVEKIVELPVEVPTTIEVPVYRDRVVEKIVEVPVENTAALKELSDEVARLLAELERVKSEQPTPVAAPAQSRPSIQDSLKATSDFDLGPIGTTTFGTAWPANPARGDLFLKVDMKPNRLYKWNNKKWIEIDRGRVDDTLVYDNAYIDHLIQQVRKGHLEYDDLTEMEQQQIIARIRETGIES